MIRIKALFSFENLLLLGIVVFFILFCKYCPIIN